jgi:hypothetical protein
MEQLVDIVAVEVVGDHRVRITFEDATVGEVDLLAANGAVSSSRSAIPPTSRAWRWIRVRNDLLAQRRRHGAGAAL